MVVESCLDNVLSLLLLFLLLLSVAFCLIWKNYRQRVSVGAKNKVEKNECVSWKMCATFGVG